jgi:excisionase family DNA binding protein
MWEALMTIYTNPQETDTEKPIRLLKVSDVARMTQVSPSQVYTMIQEGALPAVRFGTALRVRPEDLQKFIEDNITSFG